MSEYRHEFKYLCEEKQLALLRANLSPLMEADPHAGPDGIYTVRSLYFDTLGDRLLRENIDGVEPREKFRIRLYNGDASRLRLELKRKEHGMTQKLSCSLSRKACSRLLAGEAPPPAAVPGSVYLRFFTLWQSALLRPRIIVEYDRTPLLYQNGNVRVTLDTDIRSSYDLGEFLSPQSAGPLACRPVMPPGIHLLEVKYDAFLPDFIYRAVQALRPHRVTYSKYVLCRRYAPALRAPHFFDCL
ncbi:MAG: polyphosphate polymerase domain-containing protein [Eubacteriales bacterium]|nr:polyphosphate polymerase domain-containing protein [Eubacteriales bacterium]